MSKKSMLLLGILVSVGVVNAANLVVNGNFEQLPGGTGWTQWWGGNSNRYVTDPVEGDHCAGVWWHDDGILQSIAIGPGMYEFGGKLMTTQGLANRRGVIQADIGDGANIWWSQQLNIVPGDATNTWYVAKPAAGFPDSAIIDNTTSGATYVTLHLMMVSDPIAPSGIMFYDDIYLGPVGVSKEPKFPTPANNTTVPPTTNVLSWSNPDPNNPADIVTSDVYLGANSVSNLALIADNTAEESVTVSLMPGTQYYWRVNSTDPHGDPNTGGPLTTQGPVWTFTTNSDVPPVVNAGTDKYIWLNMNDGDGNPAQVTFTLNGQVVDDGKSTLTTLWSLDYSEQDPATTVTIVSPANPISTVRINGTGLYTFRLDADDAFAHAEDTVTVIVYSNACAAAQGDPADMPARYPNGHGDIDGDCDTDLADFALLASSWIDCMSAKMGCTP